MECPLACLPRKLFNEWHELNIINCIHRCPCPLSPLAVSGRKKEAHSHSGEHLFVGFCFIHQASCYGDLQPFLLTRQPPTLSPTIHVPLTPTSNPIYNLTSTSTSNPISTSSLTSTNYHKLPQAHFPSIQTLWIMSKSFRRSIEEDVDMTDV